ncbi:5-carboxymethyl-2-hydroxymuconate Delta-isomerase [Legionella maioricensis]|uniref:5-carboxymethyl-2-hydroxymuconate Delta-isomerase n=1 Tax=Legionella maioricensis TaxID=2896528 RepID=A0A9X2IBH9_9GAMM|nr:5-carboxymethyl-2-hydroxymuconate Delta-isomerase [Legionella maioricensis]MCL9684934.1 5-carboxymethyl-2-hydroxymuconate Delta-isomerase [Legionella maioricensis]MCL9688234.1 5-carboxymethyl-2-hydroxymuconate Delta-isomerase [Legionella maioricensis]
MPHLTLEYSNNLRVTDRFNQLFDELHRLLAEELPTQLSSCKSRCIVHPLFFIGDQDEKNAFVHLTIKMLPGRADAKKKRLGEIILNILRVFFKSESTQLNLSLSVEILDLDNNYYKC